METPGSGKLETFATCGLSASLWENQRQLQRFFVLGEVYENKAVKDDGYGSRFELTTRQKGPRRVVVLHAMSPDINLDRSRGCPI